MTFQAKLTTKLEKFSVDDTIVELQRTVNKEELNHIVKNLLKQLEVPHEAEAQSKRFDFLVGNRLLRTNIEEHFELYAEELDAQEILNEKLIDIEYLLSLEAPKPLDTINQSDWISCVDVNETHIVHGGYDCSINIFSLKDRKNVINIENAHKQPVSDVQWLTNQPRNNKELQFISCGFDEISILWSFNVKKSTCEQVVTFKGHKRSVDCIDIQDDLVATGSFDKTIKIWSAIADEEEDMSQNQSNPTVKGKRRKTTMKAEPRTTRDPTITLTGHKDAVKGVKWLKNGTAADSLVSCSIDGLVCMWDIECGSETRKFVSAKPVLDIDHCKDSELLMTGTCDRHARLWDARAASNSRAVAVFTSHSGWVSCVAFCKRQNHFVSGGYDNLVKLWDLRSPKACLYDLIGHKDKVLDVNCNNSSLVVSGSADSTVRLFNT